MHRSRAELCAVVELQASVGDATKAVRLLQDRVKYWREISGRRIDDLQHLGGGGLPLERLARLGDEARILHRDHSLSGKVFEQRDLLISEGPHLGPGGTDVAEQLSVLAQGNEQRGPNASVLGGAGDRIVDLRPIRDLGEA